MSRMIFIIDSSDKTISKQESKRDGYLKSFVFRTWLTGKPNFVSDYTLDCQGKEIMAFRDKVELRKFANILLKEASKTRKKAIEESGKSFYDGKELKEAKKKWVF